MITVKARALLLSAVLSSALALAGSSYAEEAAATPPADTPAAVDADVARLLKDGKSIKWNWNRGEARYGHSEILIGAAPDKIKQIVTFFPGYKDLVPDKFNNSRVVAKENNTTDVYMQIPMKAAFLKSLSVWQIMRFTPVRELAPGHFQLEGRFVKGSNIRDGHVLYTWRAVTPTVTLLKMDILINPSLPAPQSAIDEELRDAAQNAVDAIHDKAQGNKLPLREL